MKYVESEKQCDKFLNRFLLRGKKFIDYACFPYGLYNATLKGEPDSNFVDDFQYFVFTKSTKSLISIRELLRIGNIEDVFVLLRTMFEGYLASRFIDEEYTRELLNDFIFIPQLIAARKVIYQDDKVVQRDTYELIEYIQRNPSQMKLGKDKTYFYDFYAYLCNYAHCNYSIVSCYLDEYSLFTCERRDNAYMAKVLVLFVYTKLFESIVTVDGEDFLNKREETECYKLVREATIFLNDRLDEFSKYISKSTNDELNKHMKKLFKNMKKSLKEEIGSLKKDFLL